MVTETINTLRYDADHCIGCGMCWTVCPHAVFAEGDGVASLARAEACMECGACRMNCPSGAIEVESGVGCAAAMYAAALKGGGPSCGCETESCC
ncbi:MAG: 4Fe-4S binding protein [Nitrospinae bacterium]|nr:4Fe-4S binding protein [Nitrospinota bacterium]